MPRRTGGFIGHRGLQAPDPPTAVTPTAGNAEVSVAFTAPSDVGDDAITAFVATTDDGFGATGSSSPLTITSLTNGTAYTTRVYAINDYGTSAPSEASASFTPVLPLGRAIFGGGSEYGATVEYIEIASLSNSIDFGDLAASTTGTAACSSSTRGVFGGGYAGGSYLNVMQYFTISSTGNSTDFGDTVSSLTELTGVSNNTRGIFAGGSD